MKTIQTLLSVVGLAASVQAWANETVVWTTITTDILTTVCPSATTFTQNSVTYTATASETITITNCPCTVSSTVKPTTSITPASNVTWTTTTSTISVLTTYCPSSTVLTLSGTTYSVSSTGTVIIPIVTATVVPVSSYTVVPPPITPSISFGTTVTPVKPTATTTLPLQVGTNAAQTIDTSFGALAVAGIAAMLL